MTVQESIQLIVRSEIKSTSIANVGNWSDPNEPEQDENIATVISFMNSGLTELYKQFNIKMGSVTEVHTISGTNYVFPPDFLHLLSVTLPNGSNVSVNHGEVLEENPGVFTPSLNLVTTAPFNYRIDGLTPQDGVDLTTITLTFRSAPTPLLAVTDVIPLTSSYMEALLQYVGYKAYLAIEASLETEDNVYYMRFKSTINEIKSLGFVAPKDHLSNKLDARGFV